MNPLVRLHLALLMFHLTWLTFWLHWEEPDTTADSADRWLRERVRP